MTEGLIRSKSHQDFAATVASLETAILDKNLTIFAQIDHAAGARAAGLALRPTLLIIFGNAMGGTPLMQLSQGIGIDLPLKILVWEDEQGITWVAYNDPSWIVARHGLSADASVAALAAALGTIAKVGCS